MASVLSTFCSSCGTYYKILRGKAVPNQQPSFDFHELDSTPAPTSKPSIREARSRPVFRRRREEREPPLEATPAAPLDTAAAPKSATREIACTECDHIHSVPASATSSPCPRCGTYISLRHFRISDDWTSEIQTCGDVHVTSEGRITGVKVQCFNLTVDGDFTGSVQCDGDFIIRRHGTILGEVRCKRLIVEKKAEVDFASPVHADEVVIDGRVHGDIHCKGCLTLKKRASLRGDIHIASLSVAEGASHEGMVRMSSTKA